MSSEMKLPRDSPGETQTFVAERTEGVLLLAKNQNETAPRANLPGAAGLICDTEDQLVECATKGEEKEQATSSETSIPKYDCQVIFSSQWFSPEQGNPVATLFIVDK